ncbi:hypothetical protein HPB47_019369 [Ixodes persulcatus]|uniref:Uncharacterized protein n=1 Tax=Ixodes persulcatus TaxID=34615 RepID=A0AC60QKX6_IXOPE|nr:hypothetical protein HPB47_019369 [Ixodes persulcatus]
MAGTFSKCRLFCPDYARRHKSKIEYQRNFRKVSDLDFELLKQLLPAEQAASVNGDDSICKNCFAMFKRDLQDFVKEQRRLSLGDAAVEEEQAMIEDVKEVISAANPARKEEERAARGWGRAGTLEPFWLIWPMAIPGAFHQRGLHQDRRKRRALAIPALAMAIQEWFRSETLSVIARNS